MRPTSATSTSVATLNACAAASWILHVNPTFGGSTTSPCGPNPPSAGPFCTCCCAVVPAPDPVKNPIAPPSPWHASNGMGPYAFREMLKLSTAPCVFVSRSQSFWIPVAFVPLAASVILLGPAAIGVTQKPNNWNHCGAGNWPAASMLLTFGFDVAVKNVNVATPPACGKVWRSYAMYGNDSRSPAAGVASAPRSSALNGLPQIRIILVPSYWREVSSHAR